MSRPVVLIADKLSQSTVDALGDSVEVRWVDGPNRPELLEAVKDADALLVRSATTVDKEVLEAAPNLKIVGRAGVGLDNVDIETATERGVMVAKTHRRRTFTQHVSTLSPCCCRLLARFLPPTRPFVRGSGSVPRSRALKFSTRPSVSSVSATLVSCSRSV